MKNFLISILFLIPSILYGAVRAKDYLRIYDDTDSVCLQNDSSADRIYHDRDCNSVKDAGDNYVDGTGGNVSKVGTPVDNQVGVWTGDGTIEGDTDFQWNGSTLTVPAISMSTMVNVAQIRFDDGTILVSSPTSSGSDLSGYLTTSSATATYLQKSSATATYQPLDSDLTDLADGTLTGSKVGDGVPAQNIAAGTLPSDVQVSSIAVTAYSSNNTIRSNLGLAIGTNVQAYDADLDDLADGSLTGSKVGSGVPAANIASGSLGASVLASSVTAASVGLVSVNLDNIDASIEWEDATDLEADGSLSNDVVAAAEMANADHGDVSWSGGVATVDNVAAANIASGSLGASVIASSVAVDAVGLPQLSASGTPSASTFLRGDNSWATSTGSDDLGNHVATTTLNMAGFPVVNVSSFTLNGSSPTVISSTWTSVFIRLTNQNDNDFAIYETSGSINNNRIATFADPIPASWPIIGSSDTYTVSGSSVVLWGRTHCAITISTISAAIMGGATNVNGDLKHTTSQDCLSVAAGTVIDSIDTTSGVMPSNGIADATVPEDSCIYLELESNLNNSAILTVSMEFTCDD